MDNIMLKDFLLYYWGCFIFSYWFLKRSFLKKQKTETDAQWEAFWTAFFVCWLMWPVWILTMISDWFDENKEKTEEDMERIRRKFSKKD